MTEPKNELFSRPKPRHIGIIMDGNGRWAKARMLPRMAGHRAGTDNIRRVIDACIEFGIEFVTVYAFSTENWKRPSDEVQGLMQLLSEMLDDRIGELHEKGVRLLHIGRLEQLDALTREKIKNALELTRNNKTITLIIAWNYGGRDEVVAAVQKMLRDQVKPDDVDEKLLSSYMFTSGIPDPDLMIRTSGEMRTSNFLLWQSAYAEWFFTDTLWPDFDRESLRQALESYASRERRFGKRKPEDEKQQYAG
ncbi:MAG: isoprenyl transferase [Anaerolineae bacterium]|nr:isoprenyl transferase [Anaerolineae bacterium]